MSTKTLPTSALLEAVVNVPVQLELPDGESVQVRIYGQKKPKTPAPLVVYFHSGAEQTNGVDGPCLAGRIFHSAGAIVVAVPYPQTPFPQPVNTGYGVLQWAYRQRNKLAGHGAKVYLSGIEAGGNLSAAVALMARDQLHPPLAGQILISPMLDPCVGSASQRHASKSTADSLWVDIWHQFLRCPRDAEHPYAVPAKAFRMDGLPPTLVLVGDTDPMRDEALAYAEKLTAAGLTVVQRVLTKQAPTPETLLHSQPVECPCALQAKTEFEQFFALTGSQPNG